MTRPVVMFDLDDTLFAHRESVVAGIHGHRSALGGALAAADAASVAEHWNALEEEHYTRYLTGELDYLGQRRARVRGLLGRHGLAIDDDAAAEAWFEDYLVHYRNAWALHSDVLPALEALRPARFGLITNGERAFQQAKIDRVGLAEWLDDIVASAEVGITKPDERIFALACERRGGCRVRRGSPPHRRGRGDASRAAGHLDRPARSRHPGRARRGVRGGRPRHPVPLPAAGAAEVTRLVGIVLE